MARTFAFGQEGRLTFVDRLGSRMSLRRVKAAVGNFEGLVIGDFGCGYQASLTRALLPRLGRGTLIDISVADDLKANPKLEVIEGSLPEAMSKVETRSLDVALCISVLEHLWQPEMMLSELHRVLRPAGICLINVPSWLGKQFLEFSAFRLGLSPAEEMDDHKAYYDPDDLWPLLVRAGFKPSKIRCSRHKFGLNTFATCIAESEPA